MNSQRINTARKYALTLSGVLAIGVSIATVVISLVALSRLDFLERDSRTTIQFLILAIIVELALVAYAYRILREVVFLKTSVRNVEFFSLHYNRWTVSQTANSTLLITCLYAID